MIRTLLVFVLLTAIAPLGAIAKSVYIPRQFSTAPWNEWSLERSRQSENFVLFWGARVGTDPTTHADPALRFDPDGLLDYLEASYATFVDDVGFIADDSTTNLGRYKIVVVMNETYAGEGGPTGWAFGAQYDDTIGAMWVHPGATRDPYVLSHELAHALQAQNAIDVNRAGGFVGFEPAGWFWEAHANFMRAVEFPRFAADDMPRWLATRSFHLSSTRHHYSAFKWLMAIEASHGGIETVNRLWSASRRNEHPLVTLRWTKGWSQSDLNDFIFDYARREVSFDYPTRGWGEAMRTQREIYRTTRSENHWLWREHVILDRVDSATGHYRVPDYAAPQDYGINIIPLHVTCPSRTVQVRFKGHDESDTSRGWRWGFVTLRSSGTVARYGAIARSSDSALFITLEPEERELHLVVVGAPRTHTSYPWEPGWPKIRRFPYELRIENALPEGYQPAYREDLRRLFAGRRHSNGGGWVASEASVAPSVFVARDAAVLGTSRLDGGVRVEGRARLENVAATGKALFADDAHVVGGSYADSVVVADAAILYDCSVSGGTRIGANAFAWGATLAGALVIGGDAEPGSCSTPGVYLQVPHPNNGRTECDGADSSHASNVDINAPDTPFTLDDLAWTPVGCDISGVDRPGAETIGEPRVTIAPMPIGDEARITIGGIAPSASLTLRVVDLLGREILRRQLGASRAVTITREELGAATSGFIIIEDGDRQYVRPLLLTGP